MINTIFVTTIVLLCPSSSQNRFPVGWTLAFVLFEIKAVTWQMLGSPLAVFTITAVISTPGFGTFRASCIATTTTFRLSLLQLRRLGLHLLGDSGIGVRERRDCFRQGGIRFHQFVHRVFAGHRGACQTTKASLEIIEGKRRGTSSRRITIAASCSTCEASLGT